MVDDSLTPSTPRFGAGLTEAEVRRFQMILREECCVELPLTEAWSRAISVLSLVEMLLQSRGLFDRPELLESKRFALPRS
jgi:hypothetical protein